MLSQNELSILTRLRKDSRSNISRLAVDLHIPVAKVVKNLKRLEDKKIIRKYVSLLDFSLLQYHVRVNFAIKAKDVDGLLHYIKGHENINSIFKVKDDFDLYFETVFYDMAELYTFVESLDRFRIEKIDEHHVIEDIEREKMISDSEELIVYPNHYDE